MTNGTEKMGARQYSKFDKPFMPFGSVMNGLQHVFPNLTEPQREKLIQWAWNWSVKTVDEHVDNMYKESQTEADRLTASLASTKKTQAL